jgi:Cft2 family RNA processing exonuclease
MNDLPLDPAMLRDLLVAIDTALHAAEVRDYPVCAASAAIQSAVLYGEPMADWLLGETAELADAKRVRRADYWDEYQATKELPA